MSQVKLTADSGGGTIALKAPASTTSNAAVQLTLPVDDGTANQYLKTDGSGALSWATVASATADVTDGNFKVLGAEGGDSAIEIHADEGDDNADKWRLNVSAGDGTLAIQNYAGGGWENSLLLYGNGAAKFYKDNTLMCETSNDGLKFPDGKGIDFSATSQATTNESEVLDDYEHGHFNVTNSGAVNWKAGADILNYVKVGKLVCINGQIQCSNGTGDAQVTNLPFSLANNGEESAHAVGAVRLHEWDINSDTAYVVCHALGNTLRFQQCRDNDSAQTLAGDNSAYAMISVSYLTDD